MKRSAGTHGRRGATSLLAACLLPLACVLLTGCPAPQAAGGPEWIASVSTASPAQAKRTLTRIQMVKAEGLVPDIQIATGSVVDSTEAEGAGVVDND